MWRDRLFWAALFAPLALWPALYLITQPAFNPRWPLSYPWLFLSFTLAYPILEEFAFRGLIQTELSKYLPRGPLALISLPNLLTSAVFVLFHFYGQAALWLALMLGGSLVFGFFRERHGSLDAPIALHMLYNGGSFWLFLAI